LSSRIASFRDRLLQRAPLLGTWVKLPSPDVCEILAAGPLDVLCLDAEHAAFDRTRLDDCLRVLRAADMPSLVRIPDHGHAHIQAALDSGATGIVVPHVCSRAEAAALARACHYGAGGRGFSGSTRAAGFGQLTMAEHRRRSAQQTTLIAQIEDPEGVDAVREIASVDALDALFVGRIDLTVALAEDSPDSPAVTAAVDRICAAGAGVGAAVGMFISDLSELARWRDAGASLFLLESDQFFLRQGAVALREKFTAYSGDGL
jgi:2-keto-3-deoxy-L-rhamnonate aldolase RhmA